MEFLLISRYLRSRSGQSGPKRAAFTHMLVLAVDVSQSAASPTMSNPVESWLKYLGWAEGKAEEEEEGDVMQLARFYAEKSKEFEEKRAGAVNAEPL